MTTVTKGYKYRIYPNRSQCDLLEMSFGCVRKVWNECLKHSIDEYNTWENNKELPRPGVSGIDFCNRLTALKVVYPWLYEVSNIALQQSLRNLGNAYSNFFRKVEKGEKSFPRFKKKGYNDSIKLTINGFSVKGKKLYIAKSKDPVKVKWSRKLPTYPSSCTITREPDGKYYVSFTTEADPILTNGQGHIGIDLGLTDFAVMTDGTRIANPKWFVEAQRRLKRYQRKLSKKIKGSNGYNKQRLKIARLHASIRNRRKDFMEKLSRQLVNDNQVISIETLGVKRMIKNPHLSKAIGDASWSMFTQLLINKAKESHHCHIVRMHPKYPSSKLCNHCGFKFKDLKLHMRTWVCEDCGTTHDRDLNASSNILDKGLSTIINLNPSFKWTDKVYVGSLDPVHC